MSCQNSKIFHHNKDNFKVLGGSSNDLLNHNLRRQNNIVNEKYQSRRDILKNKGRRKSSAADNESFVSDFSLIESNQNMPLENNLA